MRCLCRTICSKIKRLLILYTTITVLVIVLVLVHNKPLLLSYDIFGSGSGGGKSAGDNAPGANAAKNQFPGQFLKDYKPNNETYCEFMYNLPEELAYEESDVELAPELGSRSSYRVLYNVIRAKQNWSVAASVTYATHLTPEFVSHIAELVRYWEGPVSVAAFVPDYDADVLTKSLVNLCQCLPDMSKVSVHYVFPKQTLPRVTKTSPERSTCSLVPPAFFGQTLRAKKRLLYPINVCRNAARNASTTDYVMVSDIELIPSRKLATIFTKTISGFFKTSHLNFPSRIFVVPVFEIDRFESIPRTKADLLRLVRNEKAVYFHRYICSHCQKFPGIEQWLDQDPGNTIKLFASTTRIFPYHRWEPVYIGTKSEPLYSEALSWEGKQDKMTQMLEMCLMGYRFLILDGAFLVHWPGIKRKTVGLRNSNKWRTPYQLRNSRQYTQIVHGLSTKYTKHNPKCKLQ